MTITIEDVPEGIFNTIWEACKEQAPKSIRRKIDVEPSTDITLNYVQAPHTSKQELALCMTGLVSTFVILDLKRRGII